jgi:hypothetical protein
VTVIREASTGAAHGSSWAPESPLDNAWSDRVVAANGRHSRAFPEDSHLKQPNGSAAVADHHVNVQCSGRVEVECVVVPHGDQDKPARGLSGSARAGIPSA